MIENFNKFYKEIQQTSDIRMQIYEAKRLYELSLRASSLNGYFAEVGVYKGGSAQFIAEGKSSSQHFILFDTFRGFTKKIGRVKLKGDFWEFDDGELRGSINEVKKIMQKYSNIIFREGIFPDTVKGIENTDFALVHLDCDFYQSIKDGFEFFFPRLVNNGFIVLHDWNNKNCRGIRTAFQEYFEGKENYKIESISTNQPIIIKCSQS